MQPPAPAMLREEGVEGESKVTSGVAR